MKATTEISHSERCVVYLTLIAGILLAWLPLLGRTLAVADDFDFVCVIRQGGPMSYFHAFGFWRPLGHYLPIWVFMQNPAVHPLLVLATHGTVVILFFHVCRALFGGLRLPFGAALAVAMAPCAFEAFNWTIAYNNITPVPFFLANLLLLIYCGKSGRSPFLLFGLSALLALLSVLGHECLFFAVAFSGLFALIEPVEPLSSSRKKDLRSHGWLVLAPGIGCAVWVVLFYTFPGPSVPKHIEAIHPMSLVSVYARQYSLLDVFVPWFSPVTRHLLFASWNLPLAAGMGLCAALFFLGLCRVSGWEEENVDFRRGQWRSLIAIVALLLGGSLIYVMGGGFSLDSRKKYSLIVLMLLLAGWICRAVVRRRLSAGAFFTAVSLLSVGAAMTAWLLVDIWKYESRRYNDLADFIVEHHLSGPVHIIENPDLAMAWPQECRSLAYRFDSAETLKPALTFRGGAPIVDDNNDDDGAPVIEYDPQTGKWALGPLPPSPKP